MNETYFRQREAQERSAAARATGRARAAHEEMALRYRQLAGNDRIGPGQQEQISAA